MVYLIKGVTSLLLGIAINDALIFSAKSFCLSYLDNGEAISHWWAGCAAGAAQDWKACFSSQLKILFKGLLMVVFRPQITGP